MRKVALLVVISFGLAACATGSIFQPYWSRRTEPQVSSLSVPMQPAPHAGERQARPCATSLTWLTC
jgi:hypothetical protein